MDGLVEPCVCNVAIDHITIRNDPETQHCAWCDKEPGQTLWFETCATAILHDAIAAV